MKKLIFLAVFLLFTVANSAVVYFADGDDNSIELPIDSEEETKNEENKSEEETKDFTEDDDEVLLSHRMMSKEKTSASYLHFIYHDILFHNLELEVLIPPPKALG